AGTRTRNGKPASPTTPCSWLGLTDPPQNGENREKIAARRAGGLAMRPPRRYKLARFHGKTPCPRPPLERHMATKMMKRNNNGKKAAAAPKPTRIAPAPKQRTKGEIYRTIAEHTGLGRKDVAGVFDVMSRLMAADLAK